MFGKRILMLIAHPDDEVVAHAASIARARADGAALCSIYLTHGCIPLKDLWPWQRRYHSERVTTRRREADAAATALGIQPVAWANRPARHLWRELTQVYQEVSSAVDLYCPDQLWIPAYEGGNPDHDGLNAVGYCFKKRLSVLEFSEYNFFGGKQRSQNFIASDDSMRVVTLTEQEQITKRAVLRLYKSEKKNLFSIKIKQEVYRPLASYDYTQPPHQGKVGYTRFHWVPFQHPGIDRTTPDQVSSAIVEFLKA